jgi:hypothetical protein
VARVFKADLRLVPTSEGGRESPLRSGYRSHAQFGDVESEYLGVEIRLDEREEWLLAKLLAFS